MGKDHFHCVYYYHENGEDKASEYESPKHSHNIVDPNIIANILTNEIKKQVGHDVKGFIMVGKVPVGGGKTWKVVKSERKKHHV
ncbi:hypothetical protein [Solibacillus daqui]|uniref:hypothetical protein n=1 Tax=Solibacillus daqui TaxID=2912187 RepID=UPI0023652CB8|nr:hypothetical protein [Solibacillus daqui]